LCIEVSIIFIYSSIVAIQKSKSLQKATQNNSDALIEINTNFH
jgi:hypothetical protein